MPLPQVRRAKVKVGAAGKEAVPAEPAEGKVAAAALRAEDRASEHRQIRGNAAGCGDDADRRARAARLHLPPATTNRPAAAHRYSNPFRECLVAEHAAADDGDADHP